MWISPIMVKEGSFRINAKLAKEALSASGEHKTLNQCPLSQINGPSKHDAWGGDVNVHVTFRGGNTL